MILPSFSNSSFLHLHTHSRLINWYLSEEEYLNHHRNHSQVIVSRRRCCWWSKWSKWTTTKNVMCEILIISLIYYTYPSIWLKYEFVCVYVLKIWVEIHLSAQADREAAERHLVVLQHSIEIVTRFRTCRGGFPSFQ